MSFGIMDLATPAAHLLPHYPESYAKGSERLQVEARQSTRAQAYRRGQNSTQRKAIHPQHAPSNNQKCHGYTSPVQLFMNSTAWGPMSKAPSSKNSVSQQRVSQPSLNNPAPTVNIPTKMPWNL